jgi:hypothetical protein
MMSAFLQKSMVNIRLFGDRGHRNCQSKTIWHPRTGGPMGPIVSAPGLA